MTCASDFSRTRRNNPQGVCVCRTLPRDACIDARLRVKLERQLSAERDQHISRRRHNGRIRRSAPGACASNAYGESDGLSH